MPTKVRITVIDDRYREHLEEECPFKGPQQTIGYQRCNVNQTAQPVCVGLEHEDCLLRQYNRFIVEIPASFAPKFHESWRDVPRSETETKETADDQKH